MPVPSFTPLVEFVWPAPPAPKPVRAPAHKRKPKARACRPARRVIPVQVRTILDDRLNAAIESGRIELCDEEMPCETLDFTLAELELLFRILLAEEYEPPNRRPRKASASAPASAGRIQVYAERRTAGCALYHPKDAGPVRRDGRTASVIESYTPSTRPDASHSW